MRAAIDAVRAAHASLRTADDLIAVLQAVGESILASEALAAAGKSLEAAARAAMAQSMEATGCPAVALEHHVVHLGTKPARVDIENQEAIPAEFMRTPPPAPDKVAIGKALRAGAAVPGARLIGNQEPICVFRSCS